MKLRVSRMVAWIGIVVLFMGCSSMGTQVGVDDGAAENQTDMKAQAEAVKQLNEMIASGKAYTNDDILPLFDQLDPVNIDEMIGTWKGGKFDAGKSPDPINWYGKRFNSAYDAEPLLASKPDGTIYSFDKWGMAQLREIKFRDKVSGSLIYNQKPLMDYFRKIDDDTLLGLGEMKGKLLFFFYLKRDNV